MTLLNRRLCGPLFVALLLLCASGTAWASPSGLNNIPTTDVTPEETLVLQTWTNLIDNQAVEHYFGMKYGLYKGLEVGLDWKATDDPHGHVTFQAKYAFDLQKDVWKGVVGVANVSAHRSHQGHVFPYLATSYDLDVIRLHLGVTSQRDNKGLFAGIDKTVTFLDRDLQLKADLIQVNDMKDVLYSAGFLYNFRRHDDAAGSAETGLAGLWYSISRNIVLESWVTVPTTGDHDESLTVKLNYVIEF